MAEEAAALVVFAPPWKYRRRNAKQYRVAEQPVPTAEQVQKAQLAEAKEFFETLRIIRLERLEREENG